jgi:O-antigen/teichoic acid export membrane protein
VNLSELSRSITALGRESWLLFFAITVANASNYVFHVVISRMLSPSDYGALGAVLAVLILLSVPLGAVQTTVAKGLAERRTIERPVPGDWFGMIRTIVPVAVVLTMSLAVVSPLLREFLRLDSAWTALFVAMYVGPALLLTVLRGVLQGELRFKELAFVSAFPMVVRLAVGIPLVKGGAGVSGAIGASVAAECLGLMTAVFFLWRKQAPSWTVTAKTWTFLREVLPIAAGLAGMWLLVELDLILARRFLEPRLAGEYAATGLLARSVLFVPGAISLVALPHFSHGRGRGADAHKWLMSSSAMVVALGLVVALFLSLAGEPVIRLTFGERYGAAAGLLPVLSLAMVGMGLANLLVFFHIAAGSRFFQLLWPLAAVEASLVWMFHGSGDQIALTVVGMAWVAAGSGLLAARTVTSSPHLLTDLPSDVSIHSTREGHENDPELSLIIPSYNAGPLLLDTVHSLIAVLEDTQRTYEVIVVSDGSTDGGAQAVIDVVGSVDVLHYTKRHGKGVALRVGMTRARGKYVAFIDGDGDLDARELRGFVTLMELYQPDLVIGSKRHPLSTVQYPPTRRAMSWIYQRLVRILFGLNVRDTQTGMKLVRRDVLDAVLPRMLEKRFAFDLEFLVVAKRAGYTRFFEAPVRLNYRFESTVSPQAILRIALDTAAIFYRRYLLRFYDTPSVESPAGSLAYSTQLATLTERGAAP